MRLTSSTNTFTNICNVVGFCDDAEEIVDNDDVGVGSNKADDTGSVAADVINGSDDNDGDDDDDDSGGVIDVAGNADPA